MFCIPSPTERPGLDRVGMQLAIDSLMDGGGCMGGTCIAPIGYTPFHWPPFADVAGLNPYKCNEGIMLPGT